MRYFYYIWNKEEKSYRLEELTSDEAYIELKHCYRTSFLNRIQGKSFRLRTRIGWIETEAENGLRPISNFYGVCD